MSKKKMISTAVSCFCLGSVVTLMACRGFDWIGAALAIALAVIIARSFMKVK